MIAVVDFNGLAWKLLECYLICPLARLPLHHDPCHHGALAADLITAGVKGEAIFPIHFLKALVVHVLFPHH